MQAYDGEFDGNDDGGSASDDDEGGGLDGDVGSLTARALMSAERGRAALPQRGAGERLRSVSPLKLRGKTLQSKCVLLLCLIQTMHRRARPDHPSSPMPCAQVRAAHGVCAVC